MRLFLAVLGFLVLASAAWLLFQPSSGSGQSGNGALSLERGQAEPAAALASPVAMEPGTGIERTEASPAMPPADAGFLLTVVEAGSGKPIPFAEVFYSSDPAQHDDEDLLEGLLDIDGWLETLAILHRAGADGTVLLPLPREETWLVARKDDWFGTCEVPVPTPATLLVTCQLSAAVSARVVNAAGVPQAGIRVNLCVEMNDTLDPILGVETGPDGLATLRRLEIVVAEEREDARFALALGGLLGAAGVISFNPRAPPVEPIEFRLPEHGIVEVHVQQQNGQHLAGAAFAELSMVQEDAFGEEVELQPMRSKILDGVARFAPVAIGLQIRARAWRADNSLVGVANGTGPAAAGATARLELRLNAGATFLTGRLLGVDGLPLANAQLDWHWSADEGVFDPFSSVSLSIEDSSLGTDGAGRFRLELTEAQLEPGKPESLTLVQRLVNESGASVSVPLVGPLPLGEIPLGDLQLGLAPLLAAGTVTDESGAALANIRIVATLEDKRGDSVFALHAYGELRSAMDGSFELRGPAVGDRLLLRGESERHWCESQPAALGQRGIRIVMREGGTVSGRVVAEPGADLSGIQITLRASEPVEWHFASTTLSLVGAQDFQVESVRPGRYAIEVSQESSGIPILVLEDLVVVAGEVCADPRLQPIDLSGLLSTFAIRARAADGKPIYEFYVMVRMGAEIQSQKGSGEEVVLLPVGAAAHPIVIEASGYLSLELKNVTSDLTVTMQPGPQLRVWINNLSRLPEGCFLLVTAERVAEPNVAGGLGEMAIIQADGTHLFMGLPHFGEHRIQVWLVKSGHRIVPVNVSGKLDLREQSEIQSLSLTVGEEVLAQALAALSED